MIETCQQYLDRRLAEGWRECGRFGNTVFISPPDGAFIRPVNLLNDVETLRPNAAGDETNLKYYDGTLHDPNPNYNYQQVDEETADDDSTNVRSQSAIGVFTRDLYNLPASSGSGAINFIKVYFRCKWGWVGSRSAKPVIKSDTTVTEGTQITSTATWTTFSEQWNTNPADSQAWEWADIDALQIGIAMDADGTHHNMCTQVYVEIDYTPVAGGGNSSWEFKRARAGSRARPRAGFFPDLNLGFSLAEMASRFKRTAGWIGSLSFASAWALPW